jgi:hypothetical protein
MALTEHYVPKYKGLVASHPQLENSDIYEDDTNIGLTINTLIGRCLHIKVFTTTVTLSTAGATTSVGLTPDGVILAAAIRVATQVTGLTSVDNHIKLGTTNMVDNYNYGDLANGSAATTIAVNSKDSYVADFSSGTTISDALILKVVGGADVTPSAGTVEVEVVYAVSADIASV